MSILGEYRGLWSLWCILVSFPFKCKSILFRDISFLQYPRTSMIQRLLPLRPSMQRKWHILVQRCCFSQMNCSVFLEERHYQNNFCQMQSLKGALGVWYSVLSLWFKELTRHLLSETGYWAWHSFSGTVLVFISMLMWGPVTAFLYGKIHEPKRRCSLIWHRASWLPLSLDRDLRGVWGSGEAPSGQRTYPNSVVLALASSWIQSLPYVPTPMGMKSFLFERKMILDPPFGTCIESFPFIWSSSCMIPAINYSLEIALFNAFLHFDCYGIFQEEI